MALKSIDACREALLRHRDRLVQRSTVLLGNVNLVDQMIEKGVLMPEVKGCHIAEISLLVDDLERSRAFYESVFDVRFAEDEHSGPKHLHTSFGSWPGDNFFMLTLWPAAERGRTSTHFGFMVDDLDSVWRRALAAGATEFWAPRDSSAMPRNAKFGDPDENEVFLYES